MTPDQRLRVFVSSTLQELAPERAAAREAIESLALTPVLFELGARPHPPRELYRSYLAQSQVFVGIYWQSYGWVAPGEDVSGLEDEYAHSEGKPRLVYVKDPAPEREDELKRFLAGLRSEGSVSYKPFRTGAELSELVRNDLALLMAERFAGVGQELPSGTVTMVFTDIEGSTRLLRTLGDRYASVLQDHHRLLRSTWRAHGGREIGVEGDSFFVVFPRAKDAVAAAGEAQRCLAAHRWPEGGDVRVRIGIHTGEPDLGGSGYIGLGVHRAARIAAAGHGGQVLLSEATRHVLEGDEPPGITVRELAPQRLREFDNPQRPFQLVIEGLRPAFPPLRTLDAEMSPRMQSLPLQGTSLVGRTAELAQIEALLGEDEVRLLTLTGPGGIGKTRLAVEAAERVRSKYRHGVAFVPLESLGSASLVAAAIAGALELREAASELLDGIVSYLQGKEILLVLDNFEHVIEAAPVVSTLLAAASDLTVLVTSRQLLRLTSERELPVPPLDPEAEAASLFVDRATAAHHAFELDPADLEVVGEICRRLDGVPLAIELAAPRMRLLTPRQLLDRLSERLTLAGPRDAPARQQTLEAAIAWSYELLDPVERRAFERLGCFRASFALEAAEAVCDVQGADFLDVLGSLLDKSIIYRLPDPEGSRFAMLSLIREYAFAQLAGSGDLDDALARLSDYYVAFAGRCEQAARFASWEWRRWVDQEADNVRLAVGWLIEQRRGPDLAAVIRGLWFWLWFRGLVQEARRWTLEALTGGRLTQADRAWMLAIDGLFAFFEADFEVAAERLDHAGELFEQTDDLRGAAFTLTVSSMVTATTEGEERAQADLARGLAAYRQLGDRWGIAAALSGMCRVRSIFGHLEGAEELLEQCLVAAEEIGDDLLILLALANHASYHLSRGDVETARAVVQRAFELIETTGVRYGADDLIEALARLEVGTGDHTHAAELVGAAAALRESMRIPLWGPLLDGHECLVDQLRTALGEAPFEAAVERGRTLPLAHWLQREPTAAHRTLAHMV